MGNKASVPLGVPGNSNRKVRVTESAVGAFTRGDSRRVATGRNSHLRFSDVSRLAGAPDDYRGGNYSPESTNRVVPSAKTLEESAQRTIDGLDRASASSGARSGRICPTCFIVRPANGKHECY